MNSKPHAPKFPDEMPAELFGANNYYRNAFVADLCNFDAVEINYERTDDDDDDEPRGEWLICRKNMMKITLQKAVENIELGVSEYKQELSLLIAAAKAFACDRCDGKGWVFGEPERGHRKMLNCPACAEYRRVAKEGVEV